MPKVLAIDDEVSCLEIIEFSLTTKGYEVFTVDNGKAAIDFLSNNDQTIDLILLDMMMPEMSGIETLEKIRDIKHHRFTPIIFQTGTSHYEPINKAQGDAGMEYIIRKPYKRNELLEVIKTALCVPVI